MDEPLPLDLQPTLTGRTLLLRPLQADDLDALHAAASDPLIWEQHPDALRYRRDAFEGFFAAALASGGALLVIERSSGEVIGSSRYYDHDPVRREVAIGYTFRARRFWGGPVNHELKRLMLDHAFRSVDRVWFHVARSNGRSRRAMEKVGAVLSHETQREHGGRLLDYFVYKIESPHSQSGATSNLETP